jgi:hypothetical protein
VLSPCLLVFGLSPFSFSCKRQEREEANLVMLLNPFRDGYLSYPLFVVSCFEVFCVVSILFESAIHFAFSNLLAF